MGRVLGPADARDKVVVLGHGLWTRRFGADRGPGRTNHPSLGEAYTVVGVMAPDFQFPSGQFDLWLPIEVAMAAAPEQRQNRSLRIFRLLGRLAPGVTLAQAQGQVSDVAARIAREHPKTNEGIGITVTSVYDRLVGGVRTALLVLMGVVGPRAPHRLRQRRQPPAGPRALPRARDRDPHRAGRGARAARCGSSSPKACSCRRREACSASSSRAGYSTPSRPLPGRTSHASPPCASTSACWPSPPPSRWRRACSSASLRPGKRRARTPPTACARGDAAARDRRRAVCARGSPRPRWKRPPSSR